MEMGTVTKTKISSSNMLMFHQIFTDDDLLVEIFIRLPDLQSVVRCGAACKRWNSIINSNHYRHQELLREVESKSSSFFPFTISNPI
ncbi:F-box domain containing protein [Trema orientale]|uniref:F-box domain containing protein n=1 Tax=Trema orientale TaxID=63057 RepID=A0A2P5FJS1_TREOI|nr:F-box domain containing protein [Trema orientale]